MGFVKPFGKNWKYLKNTFFIGNESCLGPGPSTGASPYATQMYAGTPPHMGPMSSKSGISWYLL